LLNVNHWQDEEVATDDVISFFLISRKFFWLVRICVACTNCIIVRHDREVLSVRSLDVSFTKLLTDFD
jgi:hypothetical protein